MISTPATTALREYKRNAAKLYGFAPECNAARNLTSSLGNSTADHGAPFTYGQVSRSVVPSERGQRGHANVPLAGEEIPMRSLRLLWLALILVLVVPLYGQVSCNRSCPPSPNPCQVAAGRSIETGQCVYTNIDGATCDAGGATGTCSQGQCISTDCLGDDAYSPCSNPVSGGVEGACVSDICVTAAPVDECVIVYAGRINCCTQQGCVDADGMLCADPVPNPWDDQPCDPTGVEPPGDPSQTGICDNGTCVAQSGLCAQMPCPDEQCTTQDCDPATGQCEPDNVPRDLSCDADSGIGGVCHWGQCSLRAFPGACAPTACDDGNPCTYNLCDGSECIFDPIDDGWNCEGPPGQCFNGTCQPVFLGCNFFTPCPIDGLPPFGNPCTEDFCNSLGFCEYPAAPNGTICDLGLGQCIDGVCLCGTDDYCDDGKSCTYDVCNGDGSCSNPRVPDGDPCLDGEAGTCIFGNCSIGG